MKARVFKIFKDNKHHISYTHVSPPKCHDDVKSVDHRIYYTPMMEICLFNGDGSLDKESVWIGTIDGDCHLSTHFLHIGVGTIVR